MHLPQLRPGAPPGGSSGWTQRRRPLQASSPQDPKVHLTLTFQAAGGKACRTLQLAYAALAQQTYLAPTVWDCGLWAGLHL